VVTQLEGYLEGVSLVWGEVTHGGEGLKLHLKFHSTVLLLRKVLLAVCLRVQRKVRLMAPEGQGREGGGYLPALGKDLRLEAAGVVV